MRGINYLAGFGTILIFIGIYCFKALKGKQPVKQSHKWPLIFIGIVSIAAGLLLLILAIKNIGR